VRALLEEIHKKKVNAGTLLTPLKLLDFSGKIAVYGIKPR
jgi:hypothetical protein